MMGAYVLEFSAESAVVQQVGLRCESMIRSIRRRDPRKFSEARGACSSLEIRGTGLHG